MPELLGRQVDRDAHRRHAGIEPAAHLATGLAQHPVADRHDEAGFFGDRNERVRRHQTARRMAPADQRFGAAHAVRRDVDLRLVVQLELTLFERAAQVVLQRQTIVGEMLISCGIERKLPRAESFV